jgi:hypothetical protein
VTVTERPWTNESKVDAVAATRRHLQGGTLALLDHADLVRELISLEQHPLPSGRPRIPAPSGGTDDYATALLALVAELAGEGLTRSCPVRGSGIVKSGVAPAGRRSRRTWYEREAWRFDPR